MFGQEFCIFCIGSLLTPRVYSGQKAICDIWEEDIPVMAH